MESTAPRRCRAADVPATEGLPEPTDLDLLPTRALARRLHAAYGAVLPAVEKALPALEDAAEALAERWPRGGRLILVGAGTSGRIAMAEAAECPPTFGIAPERVLAVLAGGPEAMTRAVEGAEDDAGAGARAAAALRIGPDDVVVGVSASGSAPFVCAAVEAARGAGALTVGLTAVAGSPLAAGSQIAAVVATGPEPLAGSTRLLAGSAQKMALNILTTVAMTRLGHVHGSRMVDFRPTNAKLRARAVRTVAEVAGVDAARAGAALQACGWQVKAAIVAAALQVEPAEAAARLGAARGSLRRVLSGA